MKRKELEDKLIKKAWEDEEFKKQLLDNPKAVIEKETGKTLPENFTMEAVEETDTKSYLVIPKNPNELSDDQLDGAAGGWFVCGSQSVSIF